MTLAALRTAATTAGGHGPRRDALFELLELEIQVLHTSLPLNWTSPDIGLTATESRQPCYAFVGFGKVHARWPRALWAVPQRCAVATTRVGAAEFSFRIHCRDWDDAWGGWRGNSAGR